MGYNDKKNKSKFGIIIVVLVAIVLIVGGLIFASNSNSKDKTKKESNSNTSSEVSNNTSNNEEENNEGNTEVSTNSNTANSSTSNNTSKPSTTQTKNMSEWKKYILNQDNVSATIFDKGAKNTKSLTKEQLTTILSDKKFEISKEWVSGDIKSTIPATMDIYYTKNNVTYQLEINSEFSFVVATAGTEKQSQEEQKYIYSLFDKSCKEKNKLEELKKQPGVDTTKIYSRYIIDIDYNTLSKK